MADVIFRWDIDFNGEDRLEKLDLFTEISRALKNGLSDEYKVYESVDISTSTMSIVVKKIKLVEINQREIKNG